jgi:protease IV
MDDNVTPPASPTPEPSPGASSPSPASPPPPFSSAPSAPPPVFQAAPAPRRSSGLGWKVFAIVMVFLLALSLLLNFVLGSFKGGAAPLAQHETAGPQLQEAYIKNERSRNKIVVIPIEGIITSQSMGRRGPTMVEIIQQQFRRAAEDASVKAVVLKVNSPGGEVLASDDIYNIIDRFQKKTGKPVISSMGSLAASGGYYVSAPCQWIVANELTITGSIGVIMQGYNFRGLMDKVGVRPEVFKSGKYKDMLSFDKREEEITQEEREMVQAMVNETFAKFKSVVSDGRSNAAKLNFNLSEPGRPLDENWERLADGRILSGKEAHRYGFVDELGNFEVAVARARTLAGISDANVIEYQPVFSLGDIFGILGRGEERTIKIDVGLDPLKLQTGHLYFLCPLMLPR